MDDLERRRRTQEAIKELMETVSDVLKEYAEETSLGMRPTDVATKAFIPGNGLYGLFTEYILNQLALVKQAEQVSTQDGLLWRAKTSV